MLILARKNGQKLTIGPDVTVTICEIRPGQVRVGIEAPREVLILRAELERPAEMAELSNSGG